MSFAQWMGVAVTAAALCMTVRIYQPQLAALLALAAGVMLLLGAMAGLTDVQGLFARLSSLGGLQEGYLAALLKVLGVSYLSEMAARVCEDLGEKGLSRYVELVGKLSVFTLTAPLMLSMLEMILELVP